MLGSLAQHWVGVLVVWKEKGAECFGVVSKAGTNRTAKRLSFIVKSVTGTQKKATLEEVLQMIINRGGQG